jgi:hypothetical protein
MNNLPEMWSLVKIEWQFFGTLTFREPSLREREYGKSHFRRLSKFAAFGRQLHKAIDYSPRNFGRRNINCVRLEQGEIGGLWHNHFLMAGLGQHQVNRATAEFMKALWLRGHGGWADVRVFDTSQNGIEYVSKCLDPKNKYEFNKFGLARTLTFSPAFVRVIRAQERRNGAFCNAGQEKAAEGCRGIPGAIYDPCGELVGTAFEIKAASANSIQPRLELVRP